MVRKLNIKPKTTGETGIHRARDKPSLELGQERCCPGDLGGAKRPWHNGTLGLGPPKPAAPRRLIEAWWDFLISVAWFLSLSGPN